MCVWQARRQDPGTEVEGVYFVARIYGVPNRPGRRHEAARQGACVINHFDLTLNHFEKDARVINSPLYKVLTTPPLLFT